MEENETSNLSKKNVIAIVYKDLSLGGVQKKIIDICQGLIEKGYLKVYLILTKKSGEFLHVLHPNVKIIDLKVSLTPPFVFSLPLKLWFVFWKIKPDTIFALMDTFGCASIMAGMCFPFRQPKIIVSQNTLETGFLRQRPWFWFRSLLVRIFFPFSNTVLTLNNAISIDLIRNFGIPNHKIKMIRNWVSHYSGRDYSLENKDIDIIYCGRFAIEKNLGLLLESFKLLLKKRPDSILYLVGYGPEKGFLIKKAKTLKINGNIVFKKFSFNIRNYLRRTRIFALTSKTEGTPMAMLEAMSMGIPVISTNFQGVKEIIDHRISGIIANGKIDISYWMYKLLSDHTLAENVGLAAKRIVHSKYNMSNFRKTLDLISNNGVAGGDGETPGYKKNKQRIRRPLSGDNTYKNKTP